MEEKQILFLNTLIRNIGHPDAAAMNKMLRDSV
jgi:hypothetical protein